MTGTQAHCHISDEITGCLTAHMGKDDAPVVVGGSDLQTHHCTYPINEQIATRDKKLGRGTGLGVGADGDSAFTLLANHPHMVAAGSGSDPQLVGALCARDFKGFGSQYVSEGKVVVDSRANNNGNESESVQNPMLVRRLTPLECERLQGFPDGHTLIAWKGKPAEECPDGPRYKAIGNSMAVPVMRWIGKRIAAVDAD